MNTLGMQLVWLALQASVLALLAGVVTAWLGRREARAAVVVLAGSFALLLGLTAAAFCPLPAVCRWSPLPVGPAEPDSRSAMAADAAADVDADGGGTGVSLSALSTWWARLSDRAVDSPGEHSAWTIVALAYGVAVGVGVMRLLIGWRAVGCLRRRSRAIADARLLEHVEDLRRAVRCSRPVLVRECDEAGLAATVGWWRPLILLPSEWRSWSEAEVRTVLAHELAHVRHRDYLIGLLTCLCGAIYFYHPLVHWLSARLRQSQEVAADALAAPASGGRMGYLQALARLALRSPARTPATSRVCPAMSGGTLMRRIHMLRGTENCRRVSWTIRGLLLGVVASAAVLLSTLGSPAKPPPSPESAAALEPFDLSYLAPAAKGFIGIRPTVWLAQPGMDKLRLAIGHQMEQLKKMGVAWPAVLKFENIEQIVTDVHITSQGTGEPGSRSLLFGTSSVLIRLNQDFDWPAFLKGLSKELRKVALEDDVWKHVFEEVKEIHKDGVTIYRFGVVPMLGPVAIHFAAPDRRTLLLSMGWKKSDDVVKDEAAPLLRLLANTTAARKRDWGAGLKTVARAPLAVILENSDDYYGTVMANDIEKKDLEALRKIRFATLAIELGDGRPVRLIVDAKSAAAAAELEEAGDAQAKFLEKQLQQEGKPSDQPAAAYWKLGWELLQSREVRRDGSRLEWLGYSSVRVRDLIGPYVEWLQK